MIYYAPENISHRDPLKKSVFLAGSIEMGAAIDWQMYTGYELQGLGLNVFNPRRRDWDSSWEQKYENPQFSQQVNWELNALEVADYILFNILADTKSPITLLELGRVSHYDANVVVVCEEGFWRKGNVDIFCDIYSIPQKATLEGAIELIKNHINLSYAN